LRRCSLAFATWRALHKGGRITSTRLLAAALLVAGCSDAVTPPSRGAGTPGLLADVTASSVALWGFNGTMPQSGLELSKEFNPENPPLGSTVIATFVWLGSGPNIITAGRVRLDRWHLDGHLRRMQRAELPLSEAGLG